MLTGTIAPAGRDGRTSPALAGDRDPGTFAQLVAALVRTNLAKSHDEVLQLARAGQSASPPYRLTGRPMPAARTAAVNRRATQANGGIGGRGLRKGGTARIALEEAEMTSSGSETGQITGTKDKDYNIIWFTEACLSNALRLETYIQDAEREGDRELADFFRRAQAESRKGAEQGKQLLRSRLGS
jgi:hypothetical protein